MVSIKKYIIMIGCILLLSMSPPPVLAADVYVIANTFFLGSPKLSYYDIENIFTLRVNKWENGTPIKVFILPRTNPKSKDFTQKYLNMSANRYYDIIESRESSGKGNISEIIESEYGLMVRILTTPGSIGYVSDSVIMNYTNHIVIIK